MRSLLVMTARNRRSESSIGILRGNVETSGAPCLAVFETWGFSWKLTTSRSVELTFRPASKMLFGVPSELWLAGRRKLVNLDYGQRRGTMAPVVRLYSSYCAPKVLIIVRSSILLLILNPM